MLNRDTDRGATVVAGVDGSPGSEAAILWASSLAGNTGAKAIAVMVRDLPAPHGRAAATEPVWPFPEIASGKSADGISRAQDHLARFVSAALPDSAASAVETIAVDGDPAGSLVGIAAETGATLLVLGRRGRGGFASLLLGSVSDQCARHSPCPVLVVPIGSSPAELSGPVVVGVDWSETSRDALRWAAAYASQYGADLMAVHVGPMPAGTDDDPPNARAGSGGPWAPAPDIVSPVRRLIGQLSESFPSIRIELIEKPGNPSDVLAELARPGRAQMLVLGARGIGGFTALLMGSVADQVLHHAHIPIVIVPAQNTPHN